MWDVGFLFVLLFVLCLYIVLVYYLRINVTKELLGCVNSGVRDLSEAKSDEIFAFAG